MHSHLYWIPWDFLKHQATHSQGQVETNLRPGDINIQKYWKEVAHKNGDEVLPFYDLDIDRCVWSTYYSNDDICMNKEDTN